MHPILADNYFWLPKQASTVARSTDNLFNFVLWVSVFFFLLITVLLVYFVIKYRHKPGEKRDVSASHSMTLELTWTIIPSILCVFLYYYGFKEYMNLAVEPPNAYEVTVTGKMWQWQFDYPNGAQSTELHCVVNQPVRCVLQSSDVIHSMFVPSFRVKKDVVPGRYNRLWFQPTSQDGMLYLVGVPSNDGVAYAATDANGHVLPTSNQPNGQDERPSQGATRFDKLVTAVQVSVTARTGVAKVSPEQTFRTVRLLNGSNLYLLSVAADGKSVETLIDDGGNPVIPHSSSLSDLPREVQTALQSQAGSGAISQTQAVYAFPDAEQYDIFCAAYCGTNHSTMHSRVVVHRTQADFDLWMKLANDDSAKPILERGQKYYMTQGCAQCHSVDGTPITGPTWKDLFGSTQQFTDGSSAVVDEAFVHEFVLNPARRTPVPSGGKAYSPGAMPVLPIKSEQVDAIIAYMKTISQNYHASAPSTTQATTGPTTQPVQ
jgi:heme/copper-type cytochrome/quinol oxidase subunit 2